MSDALPRALDQDAAPLRISRRTVLRAALAASAVTAAGGTSLLTAPTALGAATAADATTTVAAFVDDYRTNVSTNLSVDTNAAVRILSGMQRLWQTGTAWNTGTVLDADVLGANLRYCARATQNRTEAEAARAFVQDRQDQSYAAISGLGPLADLYKAGALAVTSITQAPLGTPPTTISDAVPPGAPAGSATGAGSTTSALGQVATLVNTVRGPFASGNPSKNTYQYPRPWRMTLDSTVVDTGTVDALGYPVYDSPVQVVVQLLRQRSTTPASDGGFPSGHANAFHLAALAFAYAVPERFQELVTAAFDLSQTRIVAGMHSPVDVIGGRVLATALAAAALYDPANAALKQAARTQALDYFGGRLGSADLFAAAHDPALGPDAYADRAANRRLVRPLLTYGLPRRPAAVPMTVPKGAEVLLETRQPYLTADQRREVLRTTALGAGHPLLDGPELWGRLDLFTAADGYGSLDADVVVTMDAAWGGFSAKDYWRNDLGGRGGLTKAGSGTLVLTGENRYSGGTTVSGGTLVAASESALGTGDVVVAGGTLRAGCEVHVQGGYRQPAGTLAVGDPAERRAGRLEVEGSATLGPDSRLDLSGMTGGQAVVLRARRVSGRFAAVVPPAGYRAQLSYSATQVTARLTRS